jgi:hypothetical protein
MANQIVISSGAKVRNLSGVLTGTTGVVNSLGINVANGIPQLDGSGKILVSQLPNSVMEYKGTWNAATNTPTLVNGTGNQGDVYLCNVAGTVNFGAGAITFAVGDQAIYSGTIWQKAGGSTGTVTSVAVTETGDALTITGSPITTSGTINIGFAGISGQYVNGAGGLTTFPTLLSSVGLSMPSAFSVANSPLTANGTIAVTGAGVASQYVRGDGTLANFPTSGGGGSSVAYYFNGSVNQGTFGGNTYYEMSKVPVIGAGTDFSISSNGYISQFITDANDPALLEIPAGNWNFEMYFSANSGGGTPSFYVELYKYNGTTFTLIASSSAAPEGITNGTAIDLYNTALAVPLTSLTLTDRLAVRVYVNNSGRTITLHTENSHLCEVITTFSTGITAINGLTAQVQFLATGTSGTDFNISSATATHTFNLPVASATNTGKLSSTDWSTFNNKLSTSTAASTYVPYTGATANLNLGVFGITSGGISSSGIAVSHSAGVSASSGATTINGDANGIRINPVTASNNTLSFPASGSRTYTYPNATGTLALTSDIPSLSGYIQGSGTTNYVPKFTASGTIGNSLIYDTGTRIAIGGTSATYGVLTVQSDAGQFCIQSNTTPGKQLQIGYDHTANNSYLSSLNQGVSFTPLLLQPNGGNVGIGSAATAKLQISGLSGLPATSGSAERGALRIANASNIGLDFGTVGAGQAWLQVSDVNNYASNFSLLLNPNGGNVGIGRSPSETLDVNGNIQTSISSGDAIVWVKNGTVNTYLVSNTTGGTYGLVGTNTNHDFLIRTNNTEKMRITSGGTVFIGGTLGIGGKVVVFNDGTTGINIMDSSNNGQLMRFNNSGAVQIGSITTNGSSTSFNTTSDYRLKEDLKDFNGLDLVSKIKTYDYEWKSNKSRMYGMVAHELQEVIPYAVLGQKDAEEMQQVDYSKLVPILVKAIQELKAEIDILKNK